MQNGLKNLKEDGGCFITIFFHVFYLSLRCWAKFATSRIMCISIISITAAPRGPSGNCDPLWVEK